MLIVCRAIVTHETQTLIGRTGDFQFHPFYTHPEKQQNSKCKLCILGSPKIREKKVRSLNRRILRDKRMRTRGPRRPREQQLKLAKVLIANRTKGATASACARSPSATPRTIAADVRAVFFSIRLLCGRRGGGRQRRRWSNPPNHRASAINNYAFHGWARVGGKLSVVGAGTFRVEIGSKPITLGLDGRAGVIILNIILIGGGYLGSQAEGQRKGQRKRCR